MRYGELMDKIELQKRTKSFAVRVIKMARHLPNDVAGQVVGRQIVRSATSVGANYRAACRGRSRAEFSSKLGTVLEEADETLYWLEVIEEAELLPAGKLRDLAREADELTAIFTAGRKTLKQDND
jgi:four helix bundle protein